MFWEVIMQSKTAVIITSNHNQNKRGYVKIAKLINDCVIAQDDIINKYVNISMTMWGMNIKRRNKNQDKRFQVWLKKDEKLILPKVIRWTPDQYGRERLITSSFFWHRSGLKRLIAVTSAKRSKTDVICLLIVLNELITSTSCPLSKSCRVIALLTTLLRLSLWFLGICLENHV